MKEQVKLIVRGLVKETFHDFLHFFRKGQSYVNIGGLIILLTLSSQMPNVYKMPPNQIVWALGTGLALMSAGTLIKYIMSGNWKKTGFKQV